MPLLPVWPATMRQRGAAGVSGGPQNNIVAFEPDIGPSITRRRASSFTRNYKINFTLLTTTEFNAFTTFFHDTLDDGVLPFEWVHPMTGIAHRCKFRQSYVETRRKDDKFDLEFDLVVLESLASTPNSGPDSPFMDLDFAWKTTLAGDPTSGHISGNNATLTAITVMRISKTGRNGELLGTYLGTWDDSTNPIKGHLRVALIADRSEFIEADITSISDQTTYYNLNVIVSNAAGSPVDNAPVSVAFARAGDAGYPTINVGDANKGLFVKNDESGVEFRGIREKLLANRTYYVGFDMGAVAISNATPAVVTKIAHGRVNGDRVSMSILPNQRVATLSIATPGVFTLVGHGMAANQPFKALTTGALPTGVTAGTTYFVSATGLTADTWQFSATAGGAVINTSGTQSGTHYVELTGTIPAGITAGTELFVVNAAADTFQVSLTLGGAAINTTTAQVGTINCRTGSDSNTGLVNSAAGAFLTIQKAIDTVGALDLGVFDVTIQCAVGQYLSNAVLRALTGTGKCTLLGNATTPSNMFLNTTGSCIIGLSVVRWTVNGFKLKSAANYVTATTSLIIVSNVELNGAGASGMSATDYATIKMSGIVIMTGNVGAYVLTATNYAKVQSVSQSWMIVGAPTIGAFVVATVFGFVIAAANTYTGAVASGSKYVVNFTSIMQANGAAASLPGTGTSVDATSVVF